MTGTTEALTQATANSYTGFKALTIDQQPISGNGSTVVNVYYDREQYAVTFNSNGGSDVEQQTGVRYGDKASAPADPTMEGHTFVGWFSDPELQRQWVFGTNTVNGPTTLYAKWTIKTPTIFLMDEDGTTELFLRNFSLENIDQLPNRNELIPEEEFQV